MRKKGISLAVMSLTGLLLLAGCGAEELPQRSLKPVDERTAWHPKSVEMIDEPMAISTPDIEVEITDVGSLDIVRAETGASVLHLEPDAEYTVTARGFISETSLELLEMTGEEVALTASFPITLEAGQKGNFSLKLGSQTSDSQSVLAALSATSTTYDLAIEYIAGSCEVGERGHTRSVANKVSVDVNAEDQGLMDVVYRMPMPQKVYPLQEYCLTYQVKTSYLNERDESALWEQGPIMLEIVGLAPIETTVLENPEKTEEDFALMALTDCFKWDYMVPEVIPAETTGRLYLVAKVTLPDWAAKYASEQGLTLEWGMTTNGHQEDVRFCELRAELENYYPESYGVSSDTINVKVGTTSMDHSKRTMSAVLTNPVSFWQVNLDAQEVYQPLIDELRIDDYDAAVDTEGAMGVCNRSLLYLNRAEVEACGKEFYVVTGVDFYDETTP